MDIDRMATEIRKLWVAMSDFKAATQQAAELRSSDDSESQTRMHNIEEKQTDLETRILALEEVANERLSWKPSQAASD